MKLMVTADDYGISDAVTDGICKCARDGVLTQTGLFSNMTGAKYAVDRLLKEYPHICLGQDINMVAGNPVTDSKSIPSLVQGDGSFKTSSMHRKLDQTAPNHIPYEEALLETDNQVKRFIELVGKKPAYISGHAYGTKETEQALRDVAMKYGIVFAMDFYKEHQLLAGPESAPWNNVEFNEDGRMDFSMQTQCNRDPLQAFIDGKISQLDKALKENGIAHIHTHAGYVDRDLIRRSSFTMIRAMEADFISSPQLLKWVKEHNVELVSILDLL